jgi:hypothetical protein
VVVNEGANASKQRARGERERERTNEQGNRGGKSSSSTGTSTSSSRHKVTDQYCQSAAAARRSHRKSMLHTCHTVMYPVHLRSTAMLIVSNSQCLGEAGHVEPNHSLPI